MSPAEFKAWSGHTQRSRNGWQRDDVTLHNRGVYLLYHGGESGTYVKLEGSTVEVGTYEGAIPHIGEALFKPRGSKTFADANGAFQAVVNSTGTAGLLALLLGDSCGRAA